MVRISLLGHQRRHMVLGALLLLLLAGGCGSKTGTVWGKVTYKGEAVPGGFVNFIPQTGSDQGTVFATTIDAGGNYKITGVPLGPAKILIQHPGGPPSKPARGDKPAPRKQYPTRYATQEKSDLTFTVAGGSQEHDFELK
jgi:hypothetical protein